ncbi:RidA family protein [Rhodoplanes sp. Z2-YC6860]|uniref:RidA family protein n=1 Tax=Rhodoplanes sp. Z2-YC6860 TaxID=674703 RepID=UPI000834227D|nr:RidA family protein [Rhodoplanes sp. Z2-YC6860]
MPRELILPKNPNLNAPRNFNRPHAVGVKADGLIFLSGMTSIDPATGERRQGTMALETTTVLENMAAMLADAGSSLANVVKVHVFLHSMLEMEAFNAVYAKFFPDAPPARNVSGVVLNAGMKVEIDCVAVSDGPATPARARSTIEPKNPMLNNSRRGNRPHSPGVRAGNLIFVSGMVPIDPATGEGNPGPISEQIHTVLSNMRHLLESNGSGLDRVLKLNVSMANMLESEAFYRIMPKYFPENPPACTMVGMQLSFGNGVEIECVAQA